ncbi:MAG: DUF1841 family protein [Gammaproteobacteria bacterium]
MFYNNASRDQLRNFIFATWKKIKNRQLLEPLESQLADIIKHHKEYHKIFDDPDKYREKDYLPEQGETNPFLHIALHSSIQEQIKTDRPSGIKRIYQSLLTTHQDPHEVEHLMMHCLAELMWENADNPQGMSEEEYLEKLKRL